VSRPKIRRSIPKDESQNEDIVERMIDFVKFFNGLAVLVAVGFIAIGWIEPAMLLLTAGIASMLAWRGVIYLIRKRNG
jgi:hypothetical protein